MSYLKLTYGVVSHYLFRPKTRALLDVIASVEVARGVGRNGYGMYHSTVLNYTTESGEQPYRDGFNPYSMNKHPYDVDEDLPKVPAENGQTATPAGRYQFVRSTWNGLAEMKGKSFSPENQDRGALLYADELGDDGHAVQRLVEEPLTDQLLREIYYPLAQRWVGLQKLGEQGFIHRFRTIADYYETLQATSEQDENVLTLKEWTEKLWRFEDVLDEIRGFTAGRPDVSANDVSSIRYDISGVGDPEFEDLPDISAEMLARMDVLATEETAPLRARPTPIEGELDIGDLRFGSTLVDEVTGKTREATASELNQPTGMAQQNASSIAVMQMLRTETNPVIGDGKTMPEVGVTIQVNATYRDDVNRVLRPLVAMQKRCPFVPVRNGDVARLMLGIGPTKSVKDFVQERMPDLYAQVEGDEAEEARLESMKASELWVPATLRDISVRSQPGARDLFTVNVTMAYANIQPYVPEMTFWENTTDALRWARYLGYRSNQGLSVRSMSGPSATAITGTGSRVNINQPMLSGQMSDPNQSYVFKKFYRGLLEEYQGVSGNYRVVQDTIRELETALERGIDPETGEELTPERRLELQDDLDRYLSKIDREVPALGTSEGGDPVREPAYPIASTSRLFEPYDPDSILGLSYVTASNLTSRTARQNEMNARFEERRAELQLLDSVAENFGTQDTEVDGVPNLGDFSAWTFTLGRDVSAAFQGVGYTHDMIRNNVETALQQLSNEASQFNTAEHRFRIEDGKVVADFLGESSPATLEALTEDLNAQIDTNQEGQEAVTSIIQGNNFILEQGLTSFKLQDPTDSRMQVSFGEQAQKLQNALLTRILTATSTAQKELQDFNLYGDVIDIYKRENNTNESPPELWWASLESVRAWIEAIDKYTPVPRNEGPPIEGATLADDAEEDNDGPQQDEAEPFSTYVAPQILEGAENPPDPAVLRAQRQELIDVVRDTQDLKKRLHESLEIERNGRAQKYLNENSTIERGFLNLSKSTIENVSLRFSPRLADRPWDGYPTPVTQHIGGNGAEVTIELETDDVVLLTQLSDLKQSQEALAELRKKKPVVPPLMEAVGEGSILRAFGIKNLAYRSHSQFMMEDNPGHYKVRLVLIQDEDTLVNSERFRQVSMQLGANYYHNRELAPLFAPTYFKFGHEGARLPSTSQVFQEVESVSPINVLWHFYQQTGVPVLEPTTPAPLFDERLEPIEAYTAGGGGTIHTVLYQIKTEKQPAAVYAGFNPKDERQEFAWRVRFHHEGDASGEGRLINLDSLLTPLTSYLDFAEGQLPEQDFKLLVRGVEEALSTRGFRAGFLMGLLLSSISIHDKILDSREGSKSYDERLDEQYGAEGGRSNPEDAWKDWNNPDKGPSWKDNLSQMVGQLLLDRPDGSAAPVMASMTMKRAMDDLARTIMDREPMLESYLAWLDQQQFAQMIETSAEEEKKGAKTSPDRSWEIAEQVQQEAVQNAQAHLEELQRQDRKISEELDETLASLDGLHEVNGGHSEDEFEQTNLPDGNVKFRVLHDRVDDLSAEKEALFEKIKDAEAQLEDARSSVGKPAAQSVEGDDTGASGRSRYRFTHGIELLPSESPWGWSAIPQSIQEKADILDKLGAVMPSSYHDLLMPEVREETEGMNIVGYDFPFGPGTDDLGGDVFIDDYRKAEENRFRLAVQMASIGSGVLEDHLYDEDAEGEAARDVAEVGRRRKARESFKRLQQMDARTPTDERKREADKLWNELTGTKLGSAFEGVYEDLKTRTDHMPPDVANATAQEEFVRLAEYGVFSGAAKKRKLLPRDFTNLLRTAQTLRYTTILLEKAEFDGHGDALRAQNAIEGMTNPLINDRTPIQETLASASNSAELQSDPELYRLRQDLIRLYQDDPAQVAEVFGYTDLSAEGERRELTDKVNNTWTRYLGMRRAFPSYGLILVGPVGSPFFRLVGDAYSWSAVQQIQIYKQKESASQTCFLTLSNMRRNLSGPGQRYDTSLIEEDYDDLSIELAPGRHMHVYVGYGPDIQQMYPFPGRITQVQHGPTSQIELSSYSTTLTNSPNGGSGFYDTGTDGQQLIADLMVRAITETDGLEGLGKDSFTALKDTLGRSARGNESDYFKVQQAMSMYQFAVGPFMDAPEGENEEKVDNVLADLGLSGGFRQLIQASPQLFENIKLVGSGARGYGWTDFFFGGLKEAATSGESWGWTSDPGQSLWSILKEMALVYPDYIVTTRPYNVGQPLRDLAVNPLRQTLYVGKKYGKYHHTSNPRGGYQMALQKYIEEKLYDIMAEASNSGSRFGPLDRLELYNQYFMQFLMQQMVRQLTENPGGFLDSAYNWTQRQLGKIGGGVTSLDDLFQEDGNGGEEAAAALDLFREVLDEEKRDGVERALGDIQAFPRTLEYWKNNILPERYVGAELLSPFSNNRAFDSEEAGTYFDYWTINPDNVGPDAEDREKAARLDGLLYAFIEDLAMQAVSGSSVENLTQGDMPILDEIRKIAEENGIPGDPSRTDIVKHHPVNVYTSIAQNRVRAGDSHPGFANSLTLEFPRDPEERNDPFLRKADKHTFSVKASPMLHPDYTIHEQIYMRNMQRSWSDDVGTVGSQLRSVDISDEEKDRINDQLQTLRREISALEDTLFTLEQELENPVERSASDIEGIIADVEEKIAKREREVEQLNAKLGAGFNGTAAIIADIQRRQSQLEDAKEDQGPTSELAKRLRIEIDRLYSELEKSNYIMPKYQTAACNLLQDRMAHMYQGELILHGRPDIEPYHMLHMYDDMQEMHGPVEAAGVMHHFGGDGFYTMVQPKLVTSLRGADPTIDTMFMDRAAQYYNVFNAVQSLGTGILQASTIRFLTSDMALRGATSLFSSVPASLGTIARYTNIVGIATVVLSLLSARGKDLAEHYAGMMAEITSANAVMFHPLTRKAAPYVAGLNGAMGPATIRESMAAITERAQRNGSFDTLADIKDTVIAPGLSGQDDL